MQEIKEKKESYLKEAQKIERRVASDPDALPDEAIDMKDGYRKIMRELQEKGLVAQTREITTPNFEKIEKKRNYRQKYRSSMQKIAAVAVIALAASFGASMSIEGNRRYVTDRVNLMIGNDVEVMVNNDNTQDVKKSEEDIALQEVQNVLNVQVPNFLYRPDGFAFQTYFVDGASGRAKINYDCNNAFISLQITSAEDATSMSIAPHGQAVATVAAYKGNLPLEVYEMKEDNGLAPAYISQWKYRDAQYQLSGRIKKEEFIKILEKILY